MMMILWEVTDRQKSIYDNMKKEGGGDGGSYFMGRDGAGWLPFMDSG